MKEKDVFISYKSEDFDDANWVKGALEQNGISCWMAPQSIPGGSSYAVEIPQAIRDCHVFVVILSRRAQESLWVPRELDQAINVGKPIMPFMLENFSLKDDFNFYLSNVQRYNAYEAKAATLEKMILRIKAILSASDTVIAEGVQGADIPQEALVQAPKPSAVKTSAAKKKTPEMSPKRPVSAPKTSPSQATVHVVDDEKKKKRAWIIAAAVIALTILIGTIVYTATTVTILGERYSTGKYSLYLDAEGASLSEKDLKAIRRMDKLGVLSISNVEVKDSFDLFDDDMKQLRWLTLTHCTGLTDLDFLQHCAQVKSLELIDCGVTDDMLAHSVIKQLPLTVVSLQDNAQVTDLSLAIGKEDIVTELNISNTGIKDVSSLSRYTALETISLNGLGLERLPDLSAARELGTVSVSANALRTLQGLENSIKLEQVAASDNQLSTIEALSNCTILEKVDLDNNALTDIAVLQKSKATLTHVDLSRNKLTDIDALADCENLYELELDDNAVTHIELTDAWSSLAYLSARGNGMTSFKVNGFHGTFVQLELSHNKLAAVDCSAFKFKNSAIVDLSHNVIESLAMPGDAQVQALILHNNPIKVDVTSIGRGSRVLLPYHENLDLEGLKAAYYTYYIVGCPADRQVAMEDVLGSSAKFVTNAECDEIAASII